jgi:hypothetical protein
VLILLLPITTICVALVGFYVWHRQLIRKRHLEVADAALSAFSRAEAAIVYARNPTSFAGKGMTKKGERRVKCRRSDEPLGRKGRRRGWCHWSSCGDRERSFRRACDV